MARPDQEAVDTFISITGLPDIVAIQILQEHGGDLTRAVNAHFSNGNIAYAQGTSIVAPQDDFMDLDETVQVDKNDSAMNLNLPPLINRDFRGRVFNGASEFTNHAPFVSQPAERRVIPIDAKNENGFPSPSGLPTTVDDMTARSQPHGSEPQEAIVIDDEDDETDDVPVSQNVWDVRRTEPSAPVVSTIREPDLDIEEEMIRVAIEASKRDAEGIYSSEQFAFHNGLEGSGSQIGISDTQIASSSSVGASLREQVRHGKEETNSPIEDEFQNPFPQNERLGVASSTLSSAGAMYFPSGSVDSATEAGEVVANPPLGPGPHQHSNTNLPQMQQYENGFPADEWGGISSAEHDEAVMLEAAMFGGIPETSEYNTYSAHRIMHSNLNGNLGSYMVPEPRPPSPNLTAQRQLREQQDDEYLAALQADIKKAEARRLEEKKAIEAAREEQKRKEEESLRKMEEKQELERQLAAKEASIPQEPSSDDANAVSLLVRMPDGSRRGRRFLKSDKLRSLFDYIDMGRAVKPNTYRLVRPYPRRAFSEGESLLTLSELGLTSKQEALYLELV